MMKLNPPVLFTEEQIEKIEKLRNAKYVCATEHKEHCVEVFYSDEAHPDSGSRYFALYKTPHTNELMITDGSFIEEQTIDAVTAENGEIIYSRYRHDYRTSQDGSVFIDGGRSYTKSGLYAEDRWVTLSVKDGVLDVH
jgi:hypothetical protein